MIERDVYQSPFSWRYGSHSMRIIWSEPTKRKIWRQIWLALAETQGKEGLVSDQQVEDLRAHVGQVDLEAALQIESRIHHDLMAELHVFASQCPIGGGIIHLGATSTDIEDNCDALRIRISLALLENELGKLLNILADRIEEFAGHAVIGYTHIQPAEPTTLGYRFAFTGQDLLEEWNEIRSLHANIRGKGFKGAVGTAAAYGRLIGATGLDQFETEMSEKLNLPFYPITHQTYPRRQDHQIISALANIAGSLNKFAFDLRLMQSPNFGETSEPFASQQIGSSAMPFKRNPIQSEKINSLARFVAQMPRVAWDNYALSLLERTLDDSANRRMLLPEAFLATEELLISTHKIISGIEVNSDICSDQLERYGPFASTEPILMELVRAGADRQKMHARLREYSLVAWEKVASRLKNPLYDLISNDKVIRGYLSEETLQQLSDPSAHLGFAPNRAREQAKIIKQAVQDHAPLPADASWLT